MKVAALALVLVVASAVVLIFANTLNSWVLGGLIGGLAALLISIPVSLIIFTSLARRHDEQLFAQVAGLNEDDYDNYEGYERYDRERAEVYEADAYVLPNPDDAYYVGQGANNEYDEYDAEYEDQRWQRMPEPRRLPAPGQGYAASAGYGSAQQPAAGYPQTYRRATRSLSDPNERTRISPVQQPKQQTGHQRQPRQGQTTRSLRALQQSEALRTAMREAEQEQSENRGISVTSPRRVSTPRKLPQQPAPQRRSLRQADSGAMQAPAQRQPRRDVTGELPSHEGQKDPLYDRYPTTGPIHWNPDTGKTSRHPQVDEEYNTSEAWTGSLQNPLVRRAPYLYEDDPLREQFAQQLQKPVVRRSSRHLHPEEEE